MGWQKGFDGLHATPLYMRKPEDVEKLIWGPLNVHSLATYLPLFKGKKVRHRGQGLRLPRRRGNSCRRTSSTVRTWSSSAWAATETIDINRVLAKIGDVTEVESVTGSGATLQGPRRTARTTSFAMQDVAQDQMPAPAPCPNAVIHRFTLAGSPTNTSRTARSPHMPAIMDLPSTA